MTIVCEDYYRYIKDFHYLLNSLEVAYKIVKIIQPLSSFEKPRDKNQMWPNPTSFQTKGYIIEEINNCICGLFTPCGYWNISNKPYHCLLFSSFFKKTLSLSLLERENTPFSLSSKKLWAVGRLGEQKFEHPEFKKPNDFFSLETIQKVWKTFSSLNYLT